MKELVGLKKEIVECLFHRRDSGLKESVSFRELFDNLRRDYPAKSETEMKDELQTRLEHLQVEGLVGIHYGFSGLFDWRIWLKDKFPATAS